MNEKSFNWNTVNGLIQSDANFSIVFRGEITSEFSKRVVLEINLAQKDLSFIKRYAGFLDQEGIAYQVKNSKPISQNRSPSVRIESIKGAERFIDLLEESGGRLFGIKKRDYLIVKKILEFTKNKFHNQTLGRKQVIDLKYAMHHPLKLSDDVINLLTSYLPNANIKYVRANDVTTHFDIPSSNRMTQEECERANKLDVGSSVGVAKQIIEQIDQQCLQEYYTIINLLKSHKEKLTPNPLQLHPEYLSGFVDGNGSIYENKEGEWQVTWKAARGNELLLIALASMYQDYEPKIYSDNQSKSETYSCSTKEKRERFTQLLKEEWFCLPEKAKSFQRLKAKYNNNK